MKSHFSGEEVVPFINEVLMQSFGGGPNDAIFYSDDGETLLCWQCTLAAAEEDPSTSYQAAFTYAEPYLESPTNLYCSECAVRLVNGYGGKVVLLMARPPDVTLHLEPTLPNVLDLADLAAIPNPPFPPEVMEEVHSDCLVYKGTYLLLARRFEEGDVDHLIECLIGARTTGVPFALYQEEEEGEPLQQCTVATCRVVQIELAMRKNRGECLDVAIKG